MVPDKKDGPMRGSIPFGSRLLAFLVVGIWGTTFVSTKVLLLNGLQPVSIFLIRFLIAYVCILPFAGRRLWADSWRDELLLVGLGLTGGSLYFMTENIALTYSYCANVSLIVCATPLFTTCLLGAFYPDERLNVIQGVCSLLALVGMALVVCNGHFVLKLSPLGDALALCASLTWALYSLGIRMLRGKYPLVFVTRKVFAYGVLTLLPALSVFPLHTDVALCTRPVVWGNLLYLGFVASFLCYFGWNIVMERLGVVRSTNYLYFNPMVTLLTSYVVLNEPITPLAVAGGLLIWGGVYGVERGRGGRVVRRPMPPADAVQPKRGGKR